MTQIDEGARTAAVATAGERWQCQQCPAALGTLSHYADDAEPHLASKCRPNKIKSQPGSDPMLFPNNLPRPRVPSRTPILRRINLLQPIKLPNRLQPSVDELPSARPVVSHFTMLLG